MVVAGTILQIAVDVVVVRLRELDLLHEGDLVLKVPQIHAEHSIIFLDLVASRCQFAHNFGALHLVCVEGGADGAVLAQVCRIDMPSLVDGGGENYFGLVAASSLQL